MLPFVEIAAIAMLAAAPQHAAPSHRAPAKPVASKAARHSDACRRAHRNYDAKTDTYRDARGKRQRCTL